MSDVIRSVPVPPGGLTIPGAMIAAVLAPEAMVPRGAFYPVQSDRVPNFADGTTVVTLVLLGWTGGLQWPTFMASPLAGPSSQPRFFCFSFSSA